MNLKTALGNFFGYALVQLIVHGYTFLFKAVPKNKSVLFPLEVRKVTKLLSDYSDLVRKNEFHTMMMMAHGASFLTDSIITLGSKSYAGLFQLNYLSLMAFSKHLLQYLIKNAGEYNVLIEQAKQKAGEISDLDEVWATNFRTNLQKHFSDPTFISLFDIDEWNRQSAIVDGFREGTRERLLKEQELIRQLKG